MKEFITDIVKYLKLSDASVREGLNHELYVNLAGYEFRNTMELLSKEFSLIAVFCVQNFNGHDGFTLFYAFEQKGRYEVVVFQRPLSSFQATSVADLFPSASWYEREINDGFGIEFTDAFDKRRLFLHEVYPPDFHPLLKAFRNHPIETRKDIMPEQEYRFNEFAGEGVYQIPVGPVHAGIIEPGHFRFSVIGETIFNLEIRMFYKHRGVEKLAEGKTPLECVPVAESISGDETAANATAFCVAVEKISGIDVPPRAWQLRTVFLELERIYSHLGDMAGMITDVAYPVGASNFYILREEILRQNSAITGSRFLKNIVAIGGLKHDVAIGALVGLLKYLKTFPASLKDALDLAYRSPWVIDRLETTGIIEKRLIDPLHITGPAARASGVDTDTRIDHPYGIYSHLPLQKHVLEKGDVMCRFAVKAAEIMDSVQIINDLLIEGIKQGEVFASTRVRDGYALGVVESPRGQTMHWVYIKNGLIDRYKVRTASYCNWRAIEHAIQGNIVPDFPLINKSLNLSYAGTDL
ncbi:MAG: putative hydrogenase, group 4, HycE subunit [Dehalococcoidia bacterium]|nr:putative hydrogenase, group 4, HycE subunit [Dehalococcoidia bacterium]MBF8303768.1 putative hydrogenase, group 4, HycE subunit [Dehalococcoidia bacterium]